MKKRCTAAFIAITVIIALLPAASCSVLAPDVLGSVTETGKKDKADDYGFSEILDILSSRFIGTYDSNELIDDAKRALIDSLDDNWSYYMSAEEYQLYLESSDNTYYGIGVEVLPSEDPGGIEVANVYKNSGAQAAGIVIGDIITDIDGENIAGMSMTEIRSLLRRPLGDSAILTVFRADGNYHNMTVTYSIIFQDPVEYEMLDNNIGYIYLRNFEGGSADSFIEAVELLINQGATAFIYDVRFNNGGRVDQVTRILDFLLPEGDIFISIDTSGHEQTTRSDAGFIDMPSVVLVNSYSYSGAEYVTAVLSEYGYSTTVGEQTTGKNRMQTTIPLSDGGAIHISTGMFLTPNHIDLFEQGGYTPDYEIIMSEVLSEEELDMYYRDELPPENDPQLQKAIELLTANY